MKVKDLYWAARNSTFFINLESEGRPLLCEPRLSDEGGVRIRLWLRDPAGTGTGGAIALLSRDEAAVLANAIDTRRNWVGEKADDALPRIGVSATVDSTMIRFMECRGEGHIALTVTEAGRLASWLHDMADGRWRDHNGYVPEVVKGVTPMSVVAHSSTWKAFTYATTSSASANWQGLTPTVQFLFEPVKP